MDFDKNPLWTDEEAEFWQQHMVEYSDIWWFGNCACGHPRSKDIEPHYSTISHAFLQWCEQGHMTKMPVLQSEARQLAEGTPLEVFTELL